MSVLYMFTLWIAIISLLSYETATGLDFTDLQAFQRSKYLSKNCQANLKSALLCFEKSQSQIFVNVEISALYRIV